MKFLHCTGAASLCAALVLAALQASCTALPPTPLSGTSLGGRILDVHAGRFVPRDEIVARAMRARFVILGEAHDNSTHHRLQAEILAAMVGAGRLPDLAMEQLDREHQPALDAARALGKQDGKLDAEALAQAGRFDRKGWRWADYQPLLEIAAAGNLRVVAANFSRDEARALMKSGRPAEGLAALDPQARASLEKDLVEGHCGFRPPDAVLTGMVEAQRARDAQMAKTLSEAGPAGAVLIAGAGHARRDRGAPAYLPAALRDNVLSIAFIEIEPQGSADLGRYAGLFDFVWFTERAPRADPCKDFRLPAGR